MKQGDLTELQHDALTELVNIAVSGAASRLAGLAGTEVLLTVPVVGILGMPEASETMASLGLDKLVAVRQAFTGEFGGEAMLVFPEGDDSELVQAILASQGIPHDPDLIEDTLSEVGNVLLLGFLATIGNMLTVTFEIGLPEITVVDTSSIFPNRDAQIILFIYVNFTVRETVTRGYLALVLGMGTLPVLKRIVDAFIENIIA